jgi:hypothetical protein
MSKRTPRRKTNKIRAYMYANPDVSLKTIAEMFGVGMHTIYSIRHFDKKNPTAATIASGGSEPSNCTVTHQPDGLVEVKGKYNSVLITEKQFNGLSPAQRSNISYSLNKIPARMQAPQTVTPITSDPVNQPSHYKVGGVETIDFIEAKGLGYHLGNVVKYITRAGHKGTNQGLEDLRKARWYLDRAIEKNEYHNPTN